jgi:DNA-binding IclR family transcriptional regulator
MSNPTTTPDVEIANEGGAQHQNIARAALALDALASGGKRGLRLTDVVNVTGLNKTVAHRCLNGLVANGLATFDADTSRFFLGDRIFAWVARAHERFEIAERAQPYIESLAAELADTLYFSLRRGDESICFGRAEGSFPIKTLTLNVGARRPLGVGGGSLAIAAFQDDAEVARLTREHSAARLTFRYTDDMFRDDIVKARAEGFASTEGYFIKGMTGIGVPIRNRAGKPVASISIAAITVRLEQPRRHIVVERLQSVATKMESELEPLFAEL